MALQALEVGRLGDVASPGAVASPSWVEAHFIRAIFSERTIVFMESSNILIRQRTTVAIAVQKHRDKSTFLHANFLNASLISLFIRAEGLRP